MKKLVLSRSHFEKNPRWPPWLTINFCFIAFLGPNNVGIGVVFETICYLEAEIWINIHFPAAIWKQNSKMAAIIVNFGFITFLDPKNVGIGVSFKTLSCLEAEIWTNMHILAAIFKKIQDGRHCSHLYLL